MSRGKEILVGLVIIVAVAVAVLGTLWLKGTLWSQNTRVVEVRSLDVGQLMNGNGVKFRGVTVGRVSDIRVEPGGAAVRVVLNIDRNLALPEDPVALLSPESMFGDWQVELAPRSRFPNFDFMAAPSDSVIGGYALPDISRLTATADQISKDIATITERVETAFTEETARNIADAINNIEGVSRRLAQLVEGQAEAIETLSGEVLGTVQSVRAAAETASATLAAVDSLMTREDADSILADTRVMARNFRRLSEDLSASGDDLQRTLANADSTLRRINRMAARVEAGEGSLGRMFTDTTFYVTAEAALSELELLLADFRQNPKRYINLSIF